ncbi:hypothetical protein [Candidatus Nitronereus thalassa]|uniref:Uncharacterized protein n=1 Tax=Candidatus Nitronereus thalassa TaxID=3020898 RepID=A0ABU3K9I5_9BACT|nr:hypothetical protein [Candidatus Nitronereus thalassa]MDT7043053.1 hypothetical protein [Candidatus Nitronereus thalassa]
MQKVTSSPMSIELEDTNSVATALEPALNELGLRNWKAGHGTHCTCCCSCCAAAGGEALSE